MEKVYIPATSETPEVTICFASHRLEMRGESYPENAMAFYGPIRAHLGDFLPSVPSGKQVEADFALSYFNSSSTKLIRSLFSMMNEAAERKGVPTVVNWHHDPEDDMMSDFGKDLKEEFIALDVRVVASQTLQ